MYNFRRSKKEINWGEKKKEKERKKNNQKNENRNITK